LEIGFRGVELDDLAARIEAIEAAIGKEDGKL
jgi:hypothetical protein